ALEGNAACDQVRVEADLARVSNQLDEIVAQEWLAARKMQLRHAERRGPLGCAQPIRRFRFLLGELQGIGGIRAAARTAMGQLGDQRIRSHSSNPRRSSSIRKSETSAARASGHFSRSACTI